MPEPAEIAAWARRAPMRLRAWAAHPDVYLPGALLLIAALLRLSLPDLNPYGSPEAAILHQSDQSMAHLVGRATSDAGPVMVAAPPLLGYLLTVPRLFSRDPRWSSLFLGLLNIAAVAAVWGMARRHAGRRAAFAATLLAATSPWGVILSRRLAPESLVLPLASFTLAALFSAVEGGNAWAWTLAVLLGSMSVYASQSSWPLLVVLSLLVFSARRRVRWPYLLLGVLLSLCAVVGYAYESRRVFPDGLATLVSRARDASPVLQPVLASAVVASVHAGQRLASLGAPSVQAFGLSGGMYAIVTQGIRLLWLTSLPGMVWLAARSWSRWRDRRGWAPYAVACLWVVVQVLCLSITPAARMAPQAVAAILPGGYLCMGLLVGGLDMPRFAARRYWLASWAHLLAWALAALVLAWNCYAVAHVLRSVVDNDAHAGYGVPYRYYRQIAEAASRQARALDADEIWAVGAPETATSPVSANALCRLLNPTISCLALEGQSAILLPAERPALVVLADPGARLGGAASYAGGRSVASVVWPGASRTVVVMAVEKRSVEQLLASVPVRVLRSFDAGLRLVGYAWPADARSGQSVTIATYWTFWDVPPQERLQSHRVRIGLVDAEGQVAASADGFSLSSEAWKQGLLLQQWHTVDLGDVPAGQYLVRIDLMRPDGIPSLYVDEQGSILGGAILVGPVRVR